MEKINKNIRFLRVSANLTQKELAKRLNVKTPVIGSYEEGRSIPPIPISVRIAKLFDVSLDMLVSEDAESLENQKQRLGGTGTLAITVDPSGEENVELISQKASAGYINNYSDPEYLKDLPKILIPSFSKSSTYRAFEISGQSMFPVKNGDIIIGKYLDNLSKVKKGKTYVILSKSNGIVYKRIFDISPNNIVLISDNTAYEPFSLPLAEVLEIWAFAGRITMEEEQSELPLPYVNKIMKIGLAS